MSPADWLRNRFDRADSRRRNPVTVKRAWGDVERLEDRVTPDVRVFTDATLATLVGTYSGSGAITAAVTAGSTLDGYHVVADTTGMNIYTSPGKVTKTLTIVGPNDGISPNTGTRLPEVIIDTAVQPFSISDGKSVAIRGFAFTTPDGKGALTTFSNNYSADFSFNLIDQQNSVYRSVYVESSNVNGPGYTAARIHDNLVLNNSAGTAGIAVGSGSNAVVTNNVVIGGFSGIQVNAEDYPTGNNNAVVSNNFVANTTNEGVQVGNFVNDLTLSFNTITNANTLNVPERGAIRVFGAFAPPNTPGPGGTLRVENNRITASNGGVVISGGVYPPNLTQLVIRLNAVDVNPGTSAFATGSANDAVIDLSGNWFGTAAAPVIDGTAASGVRNWRAGAYLSGNANTIAGSLVHTSGTFGFNPDVVTVEMFVPLRGATSGLPHVDGNVQVAVDLAPDGMRIRLDGDTFPGDVVVGPVTHQFLAVGPDAATISGLVTAAGGAGNAIGFTDIALSKAGNTIAGYGNLLFASTGATPGTYSISGSSFSRAADQPIVSVGLSGIGTLTANGGSGGDAFQVASNPTTDFRVNGNSPTTAPGDTLVLDIDRSIAPTYSPPPLVPGGSFTAANRAAVNWTGIEAFSTVGTPALPPNANPDSAQTDPGVPVVIPVLNNDTSPSGDTISLVSVSPPANGTATINPDGTVTYTPNAGFKGVDTFTYTAGSIGGNSTTNVQVTVGQNGPGPVIADLKQYAVGADTLGGPRVTVYNPDGSVRFNFFAYDPDTRFGVNVALGDIDGDGVSDIVASAGKGGAPHVKVLSGVDLHELFSFYAFDSTFRGGCNIAVGDTNGDGRNDLVVSAGPGGGPRVRVLDGTTLTRITGPVESIPGVLIADFFAFDASFLGGSSVAVVDRDGDGVGEVVTGAGPGGLPLVRAWDVNGEVTMASQFQAFDATISTGVQVGGRGAFLVAGVGFGGPPLVRVYQGASPTPVADFTAYEPTFLGGTRVSMGETVDPTKQVILVGAGFGGGPRIKVLRPNLEVIVPDYFAFEDTFRGGVFVS